MTFSISPTEVMDLLRFCIMVFFIIYILLNCVMLMK